MSGFPNNRIAPRVAIVHDWLLTHGGAERTLEAILPLFPQAPIYTMVYAPQEFRSSSISERAVQTSYIDRLPFSHEAHRWYLLLMTHAVRRFDLRDFEIVISISHAIAHGVRIHPGQLHINYILTPARYAWHQREDYLTSWGLRARLAQGFLCYFRRRDRKASREVHAFVAISKWIADNVQRAYKCPVDCIIYPPVDTEKFFAAARRDDYYIVVSRLVPNKHVDLIVSAFNQLALPLIVVGEGLEKNKLMRIAAPNIRFLDRQSDKDVRQLLSKAKAFIHISREDFGIAPVEAQAAGCPVIAFAGGALSETIRNGETGILFEDQTVSSLVRAVERFESNPAMFSSRKIAGLADRFSLSRFQTEFSAFIWSAWQTHQANQSHDDLELHTG